MMILEPVVRVSRKESSLAISQSNERVKAIDRALDP